MVVLFEQTDLVSFGNFLLSEAREKNVKDAFDMNNGIPAEQWQRTVKTADVQQWMMEEDQKRFIAQQQANPQ